MDTNTKAKPKRLTCLILMITLLITSASFLQVNAASKCSHKKVKAEYINNGSDHQYVVKCKNCGKIIKAKKSPHTMKVSYYTLKGDCHIAHSRCTACGYTNPQKTYKCRYKNTYKAVNKKNCSLVCTCKDCKKQIIHKPSAHTFKKGKCVKCGYKRK